MPDPIILVLDASRGQRNQKSCHSQQRTAKMVANCIQSEYCSWLSGHGWVEKQRIVFIVKTEGG